MRFGRTTLALGALVAMAAVAACGGASQRSVDASTFPPGSKMAAIASAGTLRVGVQTTYPLIGQQTLNGYEGFDIEIAKGIAKELGLSEDGIQFVPVTTPTREPFLQQDKVDIIAAAYSINEERDKVVDFAGPYLESPSVLLVPAGNPGNIRSLPDLAGKKLCVPAGGVQEAEIREQAPAVAAGLVLFDSSAKCRDAVINGSVDASSTEEAILASFVADNEGKIEITGTEKPYATSFYGIGVGQENDKVFCEWIDETLKRMYTDGTWAKAYDDTLGTVLGTAPTPPPVRSCDSPLPS